MTARRLSGCLILIAALVGVAALASLLGVWVLAIGIALAAWLGCLYIAFSRTTLRTIVRVDEEGQSSRFDVLTWKYPTWRSWAVFGLIAIPMLTLAIALVGVMNGGIAMPTTEVSVPPPATETKVLPTQTPIPTQTPTPGPTRVDPSPTVVEPTETPTTTPPIPSPTTLPPTRTETPTVSSPTATIPQLTSTHTQTATAAVPQPTSTHTRTATPVPSPTPTLVVVQPEPQAPLPGREFKNPITFRWSGALSFGQAYLVVAHHAMSGERVQSGPLTTQEWTSDLPAERFGEWRWQVVLVASGRTIATSPESMFWFNPFPGTRRARSPSPTPTNTPVRARSH